MIALDKFGLAVLWAKCKSTFQAKGNYLLTSGGSMTSTALITNLNADLWDGEHLNSFDLKKLYDIDLSSLSTANFYPVTFDTRPYDELDCWIRSRGASAADPFNTNFLHFLLLTGGNSDVPTRFDVLRQANYSDSEITIGAVGRGAHYGGRCVWLRGGLTYKVCSNIPPVLHTSDYTYFSEKYTVGQNFHGGTNTNVYLLWQNNASDRSNLRLAKISDLANFASMEHTHTEFTALQNQISKLSNTAKEYIIRINGLQTLHIGDVFGTDEHTLSDFNYSINGYAKGSAEAQTLYNEIFAKTNNPSTQSFHNIIFELCTDDEYMYVFRFSYKDSDDWIVFEPTNPTLWKVSNNRVLSPYLYMYRDGNTLFLCGSNS